MTTKPILAVHKLWNGDIVVQRQSEEGPCLTSCEREVIVNPFHNAADSSVDVIIKPSNGSFLKNFSADSGLHIGVIYKHTLMNFDRYGLEIIDTRTSDEWQHCLKLNFIDKLVELFDLPLSTNRRLHCNWSKAIDITITEKQHRWSSALYDIENNNCLDFVVAFVDKFVKLVFGDDDQLRHKLHSVNKPISKVDFCKLFVCPVTKAAASYISAHRILDGHDRSAAQTITSERLLPG